MAFDAESAAIRLKGKLEHMNRAFPGAAMELQHAHLYSDALRALRQANGCRLEETFRALAMVGLSIGEVTDVAEKQIEDPDARVHYHDAVYDMLALTEMLVAQALQANCECTGSSKEAPLIGDMLRA